MNDGKIFLVNVSKGRIGEDNSSLLGAMLITKIQLSAMERVRIPEDERKDFYLYVDEFQNFATDSFAGVLSEARKYRLNLIIAHQYIGQLVTDVSTKVRDAVFGNVGTMIIFRVGAADAEFLEPEFEPELTIQDIVNLPNYHAYIKLMVAGITVRPFSAGTLPPFRSQVESASEEAIIKMSRERYGRPREVVEKEIMRWSTGLAETEEEANERESVAVPASDGKSEQFVSICSVCGKQAKTPFKPNPNRPVYCSDCLEKLKAGEIKPPKVIKKPSEERQAVASASLASMGIEFAPIAKPSPRPRTDERPRNGNNHSQATNAQPTKPSGINKEVHLTDLKPDNRKAHEIKEAKDSEYLKQQLHKNLEEGGLP
jgi:CxxC-x17-CxxC domain-containing protein